MVVFRIAKASGDALPFPRRFYDIILSVSAAIVKSILKLDGYVSNRRSGAQAACYPRGNSKKPPR
jgi:hypothetical protein